jgi:hypothetical protein
MRGAGLSMAGAIRDTEAAEIDAFLAEEKRLEGVPLWHDSAFPGEKDAVWNIHDSLDIVRATLRFRCPLRARAWPSMSLVFRGNAIWRIDLVAPGAWKPNPAGAAALGLPPHVWGSHSHTWYDNRDHLLSQDQWGLPYRRPLPVAIRRLPQAIASLAADVNLLLEPDQRGFDVPPQAELFEGR